MKYLKSFETKDGLLYEDVISGIPLALKLTFQTTYHIRSSFAEQSIHLEVPTFIVCHYEVVLSLEHENVDSYLPPRSFCNFMW